MFVNEGDGIRSFDAVVIPLRQTTQLVAHAHVPYIGVETIQEGVN